MARMYRSSKTCSVCHQEKPISEFYKNASKIDGADELCKEDRKAYNARLKAKKLAESQLVTA